MKIAIIRYVDVGILLFLSVAATYCWSVADEVGFEEAFSSSVGAVLDAIGVVVPLFLLTWLSLRCTLNEQVRVAEPSRHILVFGVSLVTFIGALSSIWIAASIQSRRQAHCDKLRSAFLLDAGAAPVAIVLAFNIWGVYIIGLLKKADVDGAETVFVTALPMNIYAILVIIVSGLAACVWDRRTPKGPGSAFGALLKIPFSFRVYISTFAILAIGSNFLLSSPNIGITINLALLVALVSSLKWNAAPRDVVAAAKEAGSALKKTLLPGLIIVMSFVFAASLSFAGPLNALAQNASPSEFLIGAATLSLLTGSSWSTIAVFIPMAAQGQIEPVVLGAIMAGAVFGDHASPWSDTTVAAAAAADVGVLEHALHQMPLCLMCLASSWIAFELFFHF